VVSLASAVDGSFGTWWLLWSIFLVAWVGAIRLLAVVQAEVYIATFALSGSIRCSLVVAEVTSLFRLSCRICNKDVATIALTLVDGCTRGTSW
jgi:hypothetical protein